MNNKDIEKMSTIQLSPQEGALLTTYAQAKVQLDTFVVLKFRMEDLPFNRMDVIDAILLKFPNLQIKSLSPTTCSTMWILGVESNIEKLNLLDARSILVRDKSVFFIDFAASNLIEIQLHRIAYPITDAIVQEILSKYGKIKEYKVRTDQRGYPTGERWVRIEGFKNVRRSDLPDTINIRGIKGFLSVKGNDPTCTRCHKKGHLRKNCNALKCTKCNRLGHATEDCRNRAYSSLFAPENLPIIATLHQDEQNTFDEVQEQVHADQVSATEPSQESPSDTPDPGQVETPDPGQVPLISDETVNGLMAQLPLPPRGPKAVKVGTEPASPLKSKTKTPATHETDEVQGKSAASVPPQGEAQAQPDLAQMRDQVNGRAGSTADDAGDRPGYSTSETLIGPSSPYESIVRPEAQES